MKFFETAKEMEEQTRKYYLDLAEKCAANIGLRNILNMLAKDHEQHLLKFQQMADDACTELQISKAYETTIDVFRNLQKNKETFSCTIDQVTMYQQARDLVEKKLAFYYQGKADIDCPENLKVLNHIIADEDRHKVVLENIIEMVSRPQQWIEDAEFYHLDNY
jgi:rubrerythrin